MLDESLGPDVLLVRYKPLPDELLSSWLVRLAWSNGYHLERFWRKRLGVSRDIWHMDLDRGWFDLLTLELAAKTGTSLEVAEGTTLRAYAGIIVERYNLYGTWNWILPIGRKVRTWSLHGQQYCPLCLQEDEMPYFRRRWRLSFSVVCPRHGIRLLDACPICNGPVTYHESEMGVWLLQDQTPLVRCPRCGGDYRNVSASQAKNNISENQLLFQKQIYAVMDANYPLLGNSHPAFPHLFFDGFRRILNVLGATGPARCLREQLAAEGDLGSLHPEFRFPMKRFEQLRIDDRYQIIEIASKILEKWPTCFITACKKAKMTVTKLIEFHQSYPYWYESIVRSDFSYKQYHAPSEERESVVQYLMKMKQRPSKHRIDLLVGNRN